MEQFKVYGNAAIPGFKFTYENGYSVSVVDSSPNTGFVEVAIIRPNGEFFPISEWDSVLTVTPSEAARLMVTVSKAESEDEIACFLQTGLRV